MRIELTYGPLRTDCLTTWLHRQLVASLMLRASGSFVYTSKNKKAQRTNDYERTDSACRIVSGERGRLIVVCSLSVLDLRMRLGFRRRILKLVVCWLVAILAQLRTFGLLKTQNASIKFPCRKRLRRSENPLLRYKNLLSPKHSARESEMTVKVGA